MSTASRLRRPQSGTNSPRRLGGEHLREHEGSCRPCLQQRRASRQSRVLPPHRPGRRRDRRPRVARLHETRARDSGGCPTRRETRKFSKQVSARFVAQTRNARISGNSRPRSDRATARGPRRPAGRALQGAGRSSLVSLQSRARDDAKLQLTLPCCSPNAGLAQWRTPSPICIGNVGADLAPARRLPSGSFWCEGALSLDAWSGTSRVDAVATALVLATSRRSVSPPAMIGPVCLRRGTCALVANGTRAPARPAETRFAFCTSTRSAGAWLLARRGSQGWLTRGCACGPPGGPWPPVTTLVFVRLSGEGQLPSSKHATESDAALHGLARSRHPPRTPVGGRRPDHQVHSHARRLRR